MTVAEFSYHFSSSLATWIVLTAYLFAFFGLDDLLFDVSYWAYTIHRWVTKRKFRAMTIEQLRANQEQRIAIYVPCWHEDEVVEKMVELAARSIQYKNYTIFVGVYPNDQKTIDKAQAAARRFRKHVHVVINEKDGPTTKAQNLNQIYNEMERIEGENPFKIIVLHDVEDVIHPESLLVYNHLIPRRDMVQVPVFPLEREWHKWTAWTYADEFAENHLKDLVIREAFGSFVPSAGVGCAFNRLALESLSLVRHELFPTNSLTEDYQLGLRLREHGYSTIMVHQKLAHGQGEQYSQTAASFVATREFFPDTFKAAVRQKARWTAGICFQAWAHTGWTGDLFTRYTLYRDRKAVVTNLLVLQGYAVLVASLALNLWRSFDHQVFLPEVGMAWYQWGIINFVFTLTILRLMQKAYFVSSLYGAQQGILALFRVPWGAVINAFATARACVVVAVATIKKEPMKWSKTTHAFPTEAALHEYRRQLGEVLVEDELLSDEDVAAALEQRHEGERLGETLVRLGYLSEHELVGALAQQIGAEAGTDEDLLADDAVLALVAAEDARRMRCIPLRIEEGNVIVAVDDEPSNETDAFLKEHLPHAYRVALVSHRRLSHALARCYAYQDQRRKPLGMYLIEKGYIDRRQLDDALRQQDQKHRPLFELIAASRMLASEQIAEVCREYFQTEYVRPPANARVPAEAVQRIPTAILQDNLIVVYEDGGRLTVASPVPLVGETHDAIVEALGPGVALVAAPVEALRPLRHRVLEAVKRRRQLGEMLIADKVVSDHDIALAMEQRLEGERLGEALVRLGFLSERKLTGALARQMGVQTGTDEDLIAEPDALALVALEDARKLRVLPIRKQEREVIVAVDADPSEAVDAFLRERVGAYRLMLVGARQLTFALSRSYGFSDERRKPLGLYLIESGFLTRRQLDKLLVLQDQRREPLLELIVERRLLTPTQLGRIVEEYFGMPYLTPPPDAPVPLELLHKIPTKILRENFVALYELDGKASLAATLPLGSEVRDAIVKAAGEMTFVITPTGAIGPIRRRMMRTVDELSIETLAPETPLAAPDHRPAPKPAPVLDLPQLEIDDAVFVEAAGAERSAPLALIPARALLVATPVEKEDHGLALIGEGADRRLSKSLPPILPYVGAGVGGAVLGLAALYLLNRDKN